MSTRIWIDDLSQRDVGPKSSIRKQLFKGILATCLGLQSVQLRVSPKSVIICSHIPDAKFIASRLSHAGSTVSAVAQAGYVGTDLAIELNAWSK
eukprot:6412919-Pyramimonas_sp.AAC.1